jgi:hypothetical protein
MGCNLEVWLIAGNVLKSPMSRGIERPWANDLTRDFGAFFGSSVFFSGLRLNVTEATDD